MGPLLARTFFFCKWLHKFPRFLRHEGKFSTMDGAPGAVGGRMLRLPDLATHRCLLRGQSRALGGPLLGT